MKKILTFLVGIAALAMAHADGLPDDRPAWIYIPSEGVISNDNTIGVSCDFVLNVSVLCASNRTLAVGRGQPGDAYVMRGNNLAAGSILDLSEPIADADGKSWTIEKFNRRCFLRNESPVRTFVAPQELTTIAEKQFDYPNRPGRLDITLDCPNLAVLPNGFTSGADLLQLNIPNCRTLDSYALPKFDEQDVSAWDLSGVEVAGLAAFAWAKPRGTLRLPRVQRVETTFITKGDLTRLELGNNGNTLKRVEPFVCNSFRELVLGCASGCKIATNSFTSARLERVWLQGEVPTFIGDDLVFGAEHQKARSMVFYVPETAEWRDAVGEITELTDEEIAAFSAEHPDWEAPVGVVPPDVFHTADEQYIGFSEVSSCELSVICYSKDAYGRHTITVDGKPFKGGDLPKGSLVTITAEPKKATTRVRWEGKLPDGTRPKGRTISFRLMKDTSLRLRFSPQWEVDVTPQIPTISDGVWTLLVDIVTGQAGSSDRRLKVGYRPPRNHSRPDLRTIFPWVYPAGDPPPPPCAELDLSGPVVTRGNESDRWTIVEIVDEAFRGMPSGLVSFYAPETLTYYGGQIFNGSTTLENMVFNCPDLVGEFGRWGWSLGDCNLRRLVINAPQLTRFGAQNFARSSFDSSDFAEWDLTGVVDLGECSLRAGQFNAVGIRGALRLPNVEFVGRSAFLHQKRITSAELGTNGKLLSLGKTIFWGNDGSLKKIDFGFSSAFTVDPEVLYVTDDSALAVEEFWFSGRAPSVETLDRLLALRELGEDAEKPIKIFVPLTESSWRALTKPIAADEQGEAELLREDGLTVGGVYARADGVRIAWLVQNPKVPGAPVAREVVRP